MSLPTAVVVDDRMLMTVELPLGWTVEVDDDGDTLAAVAGDELAVDGLAPSITIERQDSTGDWTTLTQLAQRSLEQMRGDYLRFELLSSEEDEENVRVVRSYEFHVPELGADVRQTQGLVDDGSLYVINCTSPLAHADDLQPVFEHVVASLVAD